MSGDEQDAALIKILEKDIELAQINDTHTSDEIWSMGESLNLAKSVNGSDDIVHRSLKRMLINGVRRELKDPGRIHRIAMSEIGEAVAEHKRTCLGVKTSHFKLGKLQVSGQAATVFAPIAAVGLILMLFVYWQNNKTRESVKPMIDLVMKASMK